MPLVKPKKKLKKVQFRARMGEDLLDEIEKYCVWAEIKKEDFFEYASLLLLEKDKDWKPHMNPFIKDRLKRNKEV